MRFRQTLADSSSDEEDDEPTEYRSLRHGRPHRPAAAAPLSDSSSSSDSSSDDQKEGEKSGDSSSDTSGSSSDEEEEEEKHGWRRRKRRGGGHLPLEIGGGVLLLVVILVIAIYAANSSFSPSSPSTDSSPSPGSPNSPSSASKNSSNSPSPSSASSPVTTGALSPATTGTAKPSKDNGWFPVEKVRGVNLGSLFIFEPWMAPDSWSKLGCSSYDSEWHCVEALGLDSGLQTKFEEHWGSFFSKEDFEEMPRVGLNTVRIPLGYWTVDSLILPDEHFPRGSMKYVQQVVRWAKDAGLYVILDLHGAPGSQTSGETFTGHKTTEPGFFTPENYDRAYECLKNWTVMAHTVEEFSSVVAIHVVNEPKHGAPEDLIKTYYPGAQKAIREAEEGLGISCDDNSPRACLSIQFMSKTWGSGDPSTSIDTTDRVAYDDHNYAQWIVAESDRTREGYLKYLCTNTRSTDMTPTAIGEWSLSTIGGGELETTSDGAKEFFQQFFAAQTWAAEKSAGWIFWSWKTELNSAQWGYKDAVKAGYIPEDLSTVDGGAVCGKYG